MAQTATNPATGEKLMLQGGQWVPVGSAAPVTNVASAPRQSSQPRGIRNNNPGNVEDGAFARSLPGYAGSDGRFARFTTPEAGEQVAPRLLASYISRGYNTPNSIINRWAPPSDNNPTAEYASYVAQRAGVAPDQPVTEAHIPLIAAAIKEFENGQRVSGSAALSAPVAQSRTATNPVTGETLELVEGQWKPRGTSQLDSAGLESLVRRPGSDRENPFVITADTPRELLSGLTKGTWINIDGQTRRLAGDAYVNENGAQGDQVAAGGNAYLHEVDGEDAARAFVTAAAEQVPFLDEGAQLATAAATGRSFSDVRDQYQNMNAVDNQTNRGARDLGGIAGAAGGLALPGVGAGGRFISRGTGVVDELARAALVGAGGGAVFGASQSDGGARDRVEGALTGALTGFGVGAIGQGVAQRLARPAADTAARRLSRLGVNLTPGQMLSDVPILGDAAKYAEDLVGGFNPLMTGVRRRQNEDVVRAAGQEALDAVGQTLPREARTGYQVSQNVMKVLGEEYDKVLPRVRAQADPELLTDIQSLVTDAGQTLDDGHFNRLNRILDQNILSRFEAGGELTGDQFKRIETTLRQQSERANRPSSTLEDVDLAEALDNTREIVRNFIARQHPAEAEKIREINSGYAVAARIRRAVTGSAGFARAGTPTPGELTQTVAQMSSEGQIMNQTGLLQGLASDARDVLPASMGDTGSGQRAVIGGALGIAGTAGAAAISPALAAGIATGAIVYSRPGISLLNAVYRATDSRAANAAARTLATAAQRDPALVPYYEDAVRHLQSGGQSQSPTNQPAPPSTQAPSPALQRVMQ